MGEIIFLIGVGRSGTTLLQSMLHAHPEIYFCRETHFVKQYISKEVSGRRYRSKDIERLRKDILSDPLLSEYSEKLLKGIAGCQYGADNKYISACVFAHLGRSLSNKRYFGDKDPMNVNYLPQIKTAFPDARIIHIVRDPRDVIHSRIKSEWGSRRSTTWHCAEYGYSIEKSRNEGPILFGKNYTEVKYELLLEDTEAELRRLCEFLCLEFSSEMLNYERKAASLLRGDEMKWKSNVLNPVDKGRIGAWKKGLSPGQLAVTEAVLGGIIEKLGYGGKTGPESLSAIVSRLYAVVITRIYKLKFG